MPEEPSYASLFRQQPPPTTLESVQRVTRATILLQSLPMSTVAEDEVGQSLFVASGQEHTTSEWASSATVKELLELGLLQEVKPLVFEACGCQRDCIMRLWISDPNFLIRVAFTGRIIREKLDLYVYSNSTSTIQGPNSNI
jgi:hypothetical protein